MGRWFADWTWLFSIAVLHDWGGMKNEDSGFGHGQTFISLKPTCCLIVGFHHYPNPIPQPTGLYKYTDVCESRTYPEMVRLMRKWWSTIMNIWIQYLQTNPHMLVYDSDNHPSTIDLGCNATGWWPVSVPSPIFVMFLVNHGSKILHPLTYP